MPRTARKTHRNPFRKRLFVLTGAFLTWLPILLAKLTQTDGTLYEQPAAGSDCIAVDLNRIADVLAIATRHNSNYRNSAFLASFEYHFVAAA